MRDTAGFEDFVRAGARRHLRAAYLLTGSAADAEDLLQTALAKLARHWDRVSASGDVDAYLRKVIATSQVSRWRRRWRDERPTEDVPDAAVVDPYAGADARDALRRALAGLTPGERAVVVLRHVEDLPEAEVARLLGVSAGTVKSQGSRGLAKLRLVLDASLDPLSSPVLAGPSRSEVSR